MRKRIIASFIMVVMLLSTFAIFSNVWATNEVDNEVIVQNDVDEIVNEVVNNIDQEAINEAINNAEDSVNEIIQGLDDEETREEMIKDLAKQYAEIREYTEKHAEEIRNNIKAEIEELKKEYPALADVEDINDLIDLIYNKMGEYEDAVLEMIEDYQEDPQGTTEELMAKVKDKIEEIRKEVEKSVKQVRDYVVDGKEIVYDTLEGEGQTFDKNNPSALTFRFDIYYRLYRNYGKVYVDDILVGEEYLTHKKGSTIITLNEDYLKQLEDGEHTIKIALGNNKVFGTSTAKFTVTGVTVAEENTAEASASPKTGDNIVVFIALLGLATLGIVVTIKKH